MTRGQWVHDTCERCGGSTSSMPFTCDACGREERRQFKEWNNATPHFLTPPAGWIRVAEAEGDESLREAAMYCSWECVRAVADAKALAGG